MRWTATILGCLAVAACSLSLDQSLIDGGSKGTGGSDAGGTDATTDAKDGSSGSDAKLDAPVVETSVDAPIEDASNDVSDAVTCNITGVNQACADCGEQNCCTEWNACASDTDCLLLAPCMQQNCATDATQTCADANCAAHASGFSKYKTAANCFATECQTECVPNG